MMKKEIELPKAEIATKDWTLKELMDTERRIEKAFHDQTIYLGQRFDNQNRWMIGIMVTLITAIITAVIAMIAAIYFQ